MSNTGHHALVIGCHGGVGRALLAVLHHTTPGRRLLHSLGALMLVDREPPHPDAWSPEVGVLLKPTPVECADDLGRLVVQHDITQVTAPDSKDIFAMTSAVRSLVSRAVRRPGDRGHGGSPRGTRDAGAPLSDGRDRIRLPTSTGGASCARGASEPTDPPASWAGWMQLGTTKGIHFVEDLNWQAFVQVAAGVLGPPVIVHDASAGPRSLADRRAVAA